MNPRPDRSSIEALLEAVTELRRRCLAFEDGHRALLAPIPPESRNSARNLLHYLGLRESDLRPLQQDLAEQGLSSLGRLEAHVLATLNAVLRPLHRLAARPEEPFDPDLLPTDFRSGPRLLKSRADCLLGPAGGEQPVRIMVTMPSAAARDEALVLALIEAGMSVMRINCAHDGPEAWQGMIENLRRAEAKSGRKCPVLADLPGPKLRTGAITPSMGVVKIDPRREGSSHPAAPVAVWLTPAGASEPPPAEVEAVLPILGDVLEPAQDGDYVWVQDRRGRQALLAVTMRCGRSLMVSTAETMFIAEGAGIVLERKGKVLAAGAVGMLPPVTVPIQLHRGDRLVLTRDDTPGRPARIAPDGTILEPARIPCSLPEAFRHARPGEAIWLDDGKIGGVLREVSADEIVIEITFAATKGSRLRNEKGINLPDTMLDIPALSPRDVEALDFMAGRVDMVALSFVKRAEDVVRLQEHLAARGAKHLGIVLKIENKAAFQHLPELLLAGLRSPPVGVMVARGDLAVEIGFDRLAEVQEEILCLCEAAHVPVVWATQVLEGMARTGMPSRAEVTDAAMSGRAECVMLNKGPHIVEVVSFLGAVLARAGDHQAKKKAMLPRLSLDPLAETLKDGGRP